MKLVQRRVVHSGRGVENVNDIRRVQAEALSREHRLCRRGQAGRRNVVVERLHGMPRSERPREENLLAHRFEERPAVRDRRGLAADHDGQAPFRGLPHAA